jgi:hypothetical protein
MSRNIVYVGIDVDDERYHGSALNRHMAEVLDFRCHRTLKRLADPLKQLRDYFGALQMKLCHEASYVGFSLQRCLKDRGYECAMAAPPSIPRRLNQSVKTDRIDAAELAKLYAEEVNDVAGDLPLGQVTRDVILDIYLANRGIDTRAIQHYPVIGTFSTPSAALSWHRIASTTFGQTRDLRCFF